MAKNTADPLRPAFSPDRPGGYAPNAVQREFLRLAARRYRYIGLADTDHGRAGVRAFARDTQTAAALAAGGKARFFTEEPGFYQPYYDHLRSPAPVADEKAATQLAFIVAARHALNRWIPPADHIRVTDIFDRAARDNPGIRFIGADQRLNFKNMTLWDDLRPRLTVAAWHVTRAAAATAAALLRPFSHGVAERAREKITALGPWTTDGLMGLRLRALTDDRKTAAFIRSFPGGAAVMFGAGHWDARFERPGESRSLRTLLEQEENELCVLEIFENKAQIAADGAEWKKHRASGLYPGLRRGDAALFPTGTGDDGGRYGIRIMNPALRPLFAQAVRNAGNDNSDDAPYDPWAVRRPSRARGPAPSVGAGS